VSVATSQQQLQQAIAQHQRGDLAGAAAVYAEILREHPRTADAWHLSGLIAYQQGNWADAERLILQALNLTPQQPDYLSNLAAVLLAANRVPEAETAARSALRFGATATKCRQHLATALSRQQQHNEAIQILQQVIAEFPLNADAHCNLGAALQEANRYDEAVAILDTATQLNPHSYQSRLNFGGALRECGQLDRSLAELNTAIQLGPQISQSYVNRGNTLLDMGDATAALNDFQQAVQLDPKSAVGLNGLGRTLQTMSHWVPALDALNLACQLDGPLSRFESNRLYCASLAPHLSRQQLFDLHADWGRRMEEQTAVLPAVRYQHDQIRIGYVSPDFRNHATMRFILPLLEAHDRDRVQLYCYSEGRIDSVSNRIQRLSDGWCHTSTLTDAQLAAQIRNDEIDVLIDLAGHTAGNRLPVFAARPAPVQISFLGYPNTTGLSRIDYFLSDAVRESPQTESFFTEQLVYLPNGACCFEAPSALTLSEPPHVANGHITFGSTHRLEKISQQSLALWAQVLDSVPHSKLLVIRDSLIQEDTRKVLSDQMQTAGIDISNVEFRWTLPDDHLQIYADIDILLDVFPWGSGTTAYECMWMGVPIPTIAGDRGSCRATASMMRILDREELVANTQDDYVELTSALAEDQPRLHHLRHTIRPAMQQTVCNARSFATDIEAALTGLLQQPVSAGSASTASLAKELPS